MRPKPNPITFTIDGLEVTAPEGAMLVDGAKQGDIEIPVFCYEPKLGAPVGACRMCLVEIEGIPKLQTACSTPVKDGMVVYTKTERVKEAQSAVVEFLLVNHPLDCPVCDKGGECPLQDITMGWGPGRTRFTDPKRHFKKPVALSDKVAIDRERCILCYRCARFSQEVSEDEQLQVLERGDRSFIGTFDERPYDAPFHGNIIELCPVGALTSRQYRFRARPWEVEEAGTICTLCPSQCNIKATVRDERVLRVLARDNPAVDDGWLCDRGRFGYEAFESRQRITQPMIREGGALRPASWEEALAKAAAGLRAAGPNSAALVGGQTSNEEGWLIQRILRQALGSPHIDSRAGGAIERELLLELAKPELTATVADIDHAGAIVVLGCDLVEQMPILDLRVRKAVRRHGAKLFTADSTEGLAETLRGFDDVVVLWGEQLAWGEGGESAVKALLDLAGALDLGSKSESGLIELPVETNARGLREVGCLPNAGPGLSETATGKSTPEILAALESGELEAVLLANVGPGELKTNAFVVAIAMFEEDSAQHADVVFPAETYAEKDGTVTHPDGRLQRLRPGVRHPGETRMGWQVLVELAARLGAELGLHTGPMVLAAIADEVPFYAGITHEEIGGQGVRWQERNGAGPQPQPVAAEGSSTA